MMISSPGYPLNYYNNLSCSYDIQAPVGYRIIFEVNSFEVEPGHDFLHVSSLT